MAQFSGKTWVYRNDTVQAGALTPVSCYVVSADDPTPSTPGEAGHIWTGFAEVEGCDDIPDPAYHGGFRREIRVKEGPVVNRNRSVVIDDAPIYVRTTDD